jgi:hypothetical protein
MNASARGGLSAVVDNLPDQWLYQGAIHGLNTTQENALLQGKYLKTELLPNWYCESCDNDHDYRIITPEKVFKFCPASFEPPQPITQEERTRVLWWQPKAMATQLREANQLAIPSNQEGQLNWFPVGMGGKQLIFISVFFDFERIERCFYQLKKESILINLYPLHLTDNQESTLKGKNITVHNFTSVFENNWVLPMGTEAENADVIIYVKAKQLSFKGVPIPLARREFITAYMICRTDTGLSKEEFESQYYSIQQEFFYSNSLIVSPLKQAVNKLNTIIKEHCDLTENPFSGKTPNYRYILQKKFTYSIKH